MLNNHSIFEKKTVKGTLKVVATLIDWNELAFFDNCRPMIKTFLGQPFLRAGAFMCLGALVGKGMGELEKLEIIKQSEYLEQVRDAQFNLLNNYEENAYSDEYEEEKNYLIEVSRSVSHLGKWCLSV